jgi:hypothetical protein
MDALHRLSRFSSAVKERASPIKPVNTEVFSQVQPLPSLPTISAGGRVYRKPRWHAFYV